MTDTNTTTADETLPADVLELIAEADLLLVDFEDEVAEVIRLGREQPLDADTARRFYTRIVTILREGTSDGAADRIRAEVEALVDAVPRPPAGRQTIRLHDHNGLRPHDVKPQPIFNGVAVPMREGYAEVTDLHFWEDNDRYLLHVKEFQERYGRDPDDNELLGILTGDVTLPSLGDDDPFELKDLARSIARKGVERPPVVDQYGVIRDGHRRTAAARYVYSHPKEFTDDERERARWVKVWVATDATPDQIEAIVVGLNFEDELKIKWPEYVKARRVSARYHDERDAMGGRFTQSQELDLRRRVATHFAITTADVQRYLRMVNWAEDFEAYHSDEAGRDPASVRYRANKIFQWFYELQAGKGDEKLTAKLDQDDELKKVVYDLMWETLDSGAQVRSLYKVVADDAATEFLVKAHENLDDPETARGFVKDALEEVARKNNTKIKSRAGFDGFLRGVVERVGGTPPNYWSDVNTDLLNDVQRVFRAALGTIDGLLAARGLMETEQS